MQTASSVKEKRVVANSGFEQRRCASREKFLSLLMSCCISNPEILPGKLRRRAKVGRVQSISGFLTNSAATAMPYKMYIASHNNCKCGHRHAPIYWESTNMYKNIT